MTQGLRRDTRRDTGNGEVGHDRACPAHRGHHGDAGQSAVLVLAVVVVIGVALLAALADFGGGLHDRTRAQSAADAAALASLDGGRAAADRFAGRHGAVVVSWGRGPGSGEVTVVVRVGSATATARASNQP